MPSALGTGASPSPKIPTAYSTPLPPTPFAPSISPKEPAGDGGQEAGGGGGGVDRPQIQPLNLRCLGYKAGDTRGAFSSEHPERNLWVFADGTAAGKEDEGRESQSRRSVGDY